MKPCVPDPSTGRFESGPPDWPGFELDSLRQRMVERPAGRSRLTMLLYLNGAGQGVQGGATRLLDAGDSRST